nr:MAG TPA: hypothetical protein [Caudoviricetes sp.]
MLCQWQCHTSTRSASLNYFLLLKRRHPDLHTGSPSTKGLSS